MSLLLSVPFISHSLLLSVPPNPPPLSIISSIFESIIPLPPHYYILGKAIISKKTNIASLCKDKQAPPSLSMHFGVVGGKGGFGSLLRGQAATKRKTTNFDASRDLRGKRIRNVNNEKKLREFLIKKHEDEEKIKNEMEEFKVMESEIKRRQHEVKLTKEFKNKLERWENQVGESIAIGAQKKNQNAISNGKKQSEGGIIEEDIKKIEETIDDLFKRPQKKICIKNTISNLIKTEKQEVIEKLPINELTTRVIDLNERNTSEASQKEDKKILADKNSLLEVEMPKEEIKTVIDKLQFEIIELKDIKSIEELENLGSAHLKAELMRLGLKCGGNLRERAQRLWDIKQDPTNLFNPKYIAKVKGG